LTITNHPLKISAHTYQKFKEVLLYFYTQRPTQKPTGAPSGSLMGTYPAYHHCSKYHKQGSKV
jgi:hypothetical protein